MDVLLTDISMPGMDGIELCEQVKARHPDIQVLALSTYNQGKYILRMQLSRCQWLLIKKCRTT